VYVACRSRALSPRYGGLEELKRGPRSTRGKKGGGLRGSGNRVPLRPSRRGDHAGEGELDAHPSAKGPPYRHRYAWGVRGALPRPCKGRLQQFRSRRRPPPRHRGGGGQRPAQDKTQDNQILPVLVAFFHWGKTLNSTLPNDNVSGWKVSSFFFDNGVILQHGWTLHMKTGPIRQPGTFRRPWASRRRSRSLLLVCTSAYGLLVSILAFLGDSVTPRIRQSLLPDGIGVTVLDCVCVQRTPKIPPTVKRHFLELPPQLGLTCHVPTIRPQPRLHSNWELESDSIFQRPIQGIITCLEAENG